MIKKCFLCLYFFVLSAFCFANNLDDEILKAITFLIPENNLLIEVETPCYDETFAAAEFSEYLKDSIESVISTIGKELFDYDNNKSVESKIADYSDSGYLLSKTANISQRKMPDGTLSSTFSEKNNIVTIFFEYGKFDGTKKKIKTSISTKDLPGMKYQPDNLELARQVYADVENANKFAMRNTDKSISIVAALLDSEDNLVDIVYPDSRVHFVIGAPEKDAYVSILNISAEGKKFLLKLDKEGSDTTFIPAGETWESPNFKPVDNVYGQETLYIFAASTPKELPSSVSNLQYVPNMITSFTRELMFDLSDDKNATGTFALTYTVLPSPVN